MGGGTTRVGGALRHPLFWGALGLLLINDHLLKGAGVLPGALTGKLSDFAGLIVAPVFVAALFGMLFGATSRRARVCAFGIAIAPFVMINVAPAGAAAWEAVGGAFGLSWYAWCDPTDLVALCVLPIAWWVMDAAPRALPSRRAVEGVGLFAAAFACVATTGTPPPGPGTREVIVPPPDFVTAAYLHNATEEFVDVRLRWVEADFECSTVTTAPGTYFSRQAFGDGVTVSLDPSRNFPIDRTSATEILGLDVGSELTRACDAVLVQSDGMADLVVFFAPAMTSMVPRHGDDSSGFSGPPREGFVGGQGLISAQVLQVPVDEACEAVESTHYAYSGERVEAGTEATVTSAELLRDGCFAVSFESETREPWSSFFCVPMWSFDIVAGDAVRFDVSRPGVVAITRLADETRNATQLAVLDYLYDEAALPLEVPSMRPVYSDPSTTLCNGAHTACGAYSVNRTLQVEGAYVQPGGEVDGEMYDGRHYRFLLGSAQETEVGIAGCPADERRPGLTVNAVIFFSEVE